MNRELAQFLQRWLADRAEGSRLLELGCARSVWLPYLGQALGFTVAGVDYSAQGCELARATLAAARVPGQIILADFFDPPSALAEKFDAVVSFGVAEHFDDTAACISAFARFLAEKGRMVTVVPNMTGLTGFLQKHLNREVYEKHVPLDKEQLMDAHRRAGLEVMGAGYLISTNFGIVNLEGLASGTPAWFLKRAFMAALGRLSMLGWLAERHLPAVRISAAYVYCVADRGVTNSRLL